MLSCADAVYKNVSKEEFEDFIKQYPIDLVTKINYSYNYPQTEYYDRDLELPGLGYVAAKIEKIDEEKRIFFVRYEILENLDDLYIGFAAQLDEEIALRNWHPERGEEDE